MTTQKSGRAIPLPIHRQERINRILRELGIRKEVLKLANVLYLRVNTRGWKAAVSDIKSSRVALLRYVSGGPLTEVGGVRLTKDGLPTLFGNQINSLLRSGDLEVTREVLTVLRISYLTPVRNPIDLEPLMTPSTAGFDSGTYRNLLHVSDKVISDLGIVIPIRSIEFVKFHLTTKMGPLGIAIMSACREFTHPTFQYVRKYLLTIGLGNPIYGLEQLIEEGIEVDKVLEETVLKDSATLRRLSTIPAPEGKTRVVALVDYWTQSALRPIHSYVIKQLGVWFGESDRTFSQQGKRLVLPPVGNKFHSFDLKGFTDRFPMKYQVSVVSTLLGSKFSGAWEKLLVGLAYEYEGKFIFYRSGQPMGAYTSWAICTLCHHLVVRVAGHNVYKHSNFSSYMMLGDDLVIYDSRVAAEYLRLITVLGVEISKEKSLESSTSYEFAKRVYVKGVDISGLTWDQMLRVKDPLTVLGTFLAESAARTGDESRINLKSVRSWISILAGKDRNRYFHHAGAIHLQTIWIMHTMGMDISYLKSPFTRCSGSSVEVFKDLISWWAISRLEAFLPELDHKLDELTSKLGVVRKSHGPVNLLTIPALEVFYFNCLNIGSLLDDWKRLNRFDYDAQAAMELLLDAQDTVNLGELDFSRRLERVRMLVAHASRKARQYENCYLRELRDTRTLG